VSSFAPSSVAPSSVAERYLLLGLRLGEHLEGLVDFYFGPEELAAAAREATPEPAALAADARGLLADIAVDGGLDEQRRRWLAAQVEGLECVARMLAGEEVPWSEAVRRCYGIDVEITAESAFEAMHARLDAVLSGTGDLADRLRRWDESQNVPEARMLDAFAVLADDLRERTRTLVGLPDGEHIDPVVVSGQPWSAYNWYLGGLGSRIELNGDLPIRSHFFAPMVAHEGYPGHHTEHAWKEARLVRELGRPEQSAALIHTPECLVSEGIAEVAVEQAWGERWPERAAELLRPLDIPFDVPVAVEVLAAYPLKRAAEVNVAYFLNEAGWSDGEAAAYLCRWALSEPDRAEKAVGFCRHPLWSAYVPTYAYGYRLVRPFVDRDAGNFRRLLTEQLTTADLLAG
jgi:hypothetical protein